MRDAAFSLKLIDLIDLTNKPGGLSDTRKIRKLLTKYVGEIEFKDLKIPFRCIAVDLHSQEVVEMSEGDVIGAVIASSSIPGVFKPTERDGMRLIDGGVLERVPVRTVRHMGAKQIVAVDVLGWRNASEKASGPLSVSLETFDIMDNHRTKAYHARYKKDINFWLEPDLGDMSQYSLKQIREAYEVGYELGKANVAEIKKALKE